MYKFSAISVLLYVSIGFLGSLWNISSSSIPRNQVYKNQSSYTYE